MLCQTRLFKVGSSQSKPPPDPIEQEVTSSQQPPVPLVEEESLILPPIEKPNNKFSLFKSGTEKKQKLEKEEQYIVRDPSPKKEGGKGSWLNFRGEKKDIVEPATEVQDKEIPASDAYDNLTLRIIVPVNVQNVLVWRGV